MRWKSFLITPGLNVSGCGRRFAWRVNLRLLFGEITRLPGATSVIPFYASSGRRHTDYILAIQLLKSAWKRLYVWQMGLTICPSTHFYLSQETASVQIQEIGVVTADGYIGLAPRRSQYGDLIHFFFFGCNSLMLLRPTPKNSGLTVIEECYIHGKSEGEPLVGPYPK